MKKYAATLIAVFCTLLSMSCMAQDNSWKPLARGQSAKGQWVIERHKINPEVQQVSFYATDNVLMYKEEVRNANVNANKDKTVKRLDQLLSTIAAEWEKTKTVAGKQLVISYFKK